MTDNNDTRIPITARAFASDYFHVLLLKEVEGQHRIQYRAPFCYLPSTTVSQWRRLHSDQRVSGRASLSVCRHNTSNHHLRFRHCLAKQSLNQIWCCWCSSSHCNSKYPLSILFKVRLSFYSNSTFSCHLRVHGSGLLSKFVSQFAGKNVLFNYFQLEVELLVHKSSRIVDNIHSRILLSIFRQLIIILLNQD